VLVSSILANPDIDASQIDGGVLTHAAFGQIAYAGPIVLAFGLITFAFSTVLGWSYYGERCAEYLFGSKANIPYRVIYVIVTFLGAILSLNIVWSVADALNALMAIPNIVAVLLLSGLVVKETKRYLKDGNIDEFDHTPVPARNDAGKNI
jgi:AGCS family alanine or glycine:cation symporter